MGKSALFYVTATTVMLAGMYGDMSRSELARTREESVYYQRVIAWSIAQSGFHVIERRVRRNFEDLRGAWRDIPQSDGTYSIEAASDGDDRVAIASTGRYGEQQYTITGVLERSAPSLLDALTVDGEIDDADFGRDAIVSGIDTDPDGSDGSGRDVHAVLAVLPAAWSVLADEITRESQAPGVGSAPDIVNDTPSMSLLELANAIESYEGDELVRYATNKTLDDETVGSPDEPVVIVAEADIRLKGTTRGYGILYGLGDVRFDDDASWQGLVFAAAGGARFEMKEDSRITGAVVMTAYAGDESTGGDGEDRGLPGGHFDIDVFNGQNWTREVYHEHEYDDDFDVRGVNLISPTTCKDGGGLCWTFSLTGETGVILDVENEAKGYGTYTIRAGAGQGCTSGGGVTYGSGSKHGDGSSRSRRGRHGDEDWSRDDDDTGGGTACTGSMMDLPAVDLSGNTQNGVSGVLFDARQVTELRYDFSTLCALQPSSPGHVQQDDANRNGAFTVNIYRARRQGQNWAREGKVYELAVYHHIGYGKWVLLEGEACDPDSAGDGDDAGGQIAYGSPVRIDVKDDSRIQYSSAVLNGLQALLPGLAPGEASIVRRRVREAAIRTAR